jgi:cysteinyl-tRNA synthetase
MSMKKQFLVTRNRPKIFICGPTVYDYCHLGHARIFLFYDLMARYLISKDVLPIILVNITDIDPKISFRAKNEGVSEYDISNKFTNELFIDLLSLGIDTTLSFAKVSDYVNIAKHLVIKLLENKLAYSANGNVYLDTTNLASFGRLSRMTKRDLYNSRFDIAPDKRNPYDILLWNSTDIFESRHNDKILGNGIPWWHMQDSSIAMSNFNGMYDIHGGAIELIYPHHESHLAQLQVLTHKQQPIKYWTHVGLVNINGKKMSNSTNNALRIRDLLKKYNSNIIRLYIFSTHYRKSLNFSESEIDKFESIDEIIANAMVANTKVIYDNKKPKTKSNSWNRFIEYIEDDFDTPRALEIMWKVAKSKQSIDDLKNMVNIFGLKY